MNDGIASLHPAYFALVMATGAGTQEHAAQ